MYLSLIACAGAAGGFADATGAAGAYAGAYAGACAGACAGGFAVFGDATGVDTITFIFSQNRSFKKRFSKILISVILSFLTTTELMNSLISFLHLFLLLIRHSKGFIDCPL